MKKALLLTILIGTTTVFAQDVWVQRDSINGPGRSAAASFVINDEGWIATGYDGFDDSRRMYSYDLEQDDWDDEVSLGGASGSGLKRKSAVGFNVKEYGFVATGSGIAEFFKDVWLYNDTTKAWTQMADFGGTARREAVAFSVDTIAYVGSGIDNSGLVNDFYAYDVSSNSWSAIAAFPGTPRREAVGFTMGGRCYFGTGRSDTGFLNDFWEYVPATGMWNQLADFPGAPRMGACGAGNFPTAFIMCGEDNTLNYTKDVWEYNYFGNTWTQRADLPGPERSQAIAFTVQNRVFCGSGYGGVWYDDFYEYEFIVSDGYDEIMMEYQLYPNPSADLVTVEFGEVRADQISIYDMSGKLMLNTEISETDGSIDLNVSNFSPASYFVSLTFDSGQELVKKLIVQ